MTMKARTVLLSGRDGDWVYYVVNGKQFRRRYVRPHDPRTPAQLRVRKNFGTSSHRWSQNGHLTEQQRDACHAAAAKVKSRPRLGQSGPLTGQQYFVGRACAKAPLAPELPAPPPSRPSLARPQARRRCEQRVPPVRTRCTPHVACVSQWTLASCKSGGGSSLFSVE